jgi:hypothetical protein
MSDGGIIFPAQGTLLTKDKEKKIDYKKIGENYSFVVFDGEENPVKDYKRYQFKKRKGNEVTMDYKQFIDYLYSETYLDDKMSTGGLVSPNGKPSNLTPEQYKLVRTPAFKKWFGDWENDPKNASKVVDENGEPMVVYHGTKSSNEFFKFKKEFSETKWDTFWFSPNRETATFYSKQKEKLGKVFECFLNIKNPSKTYPFNLEKYDGWIEYKNQIDYVNWHQSKIIQVIQVVNSNQIKLADGTNTTFDINNLDIRYNEGGEIERSPEKENTEKLISELKKYCTKTTSDVMTNAEGESYVFHTWKLKYPHASNWLIKLFEKAAYENTGKTFVPQFSSGDTLFTYERPEFKGRPNGTMRMKVLEVLNKFRLGGNTDDQDKITVNIPLMIRLLEHSREDIKSDEELHFVVENLLRLKDKKTLTMEDYNYIAHVQKKHLKN